MSSEYSTCEVCGFKCITGGEMIVHVASEHIMLSCNQCPAKFLTDSQRAAHIQSRHYFWDCEYCEAKFYDTVVLEEHESQCPRKPVSKCTSCDANYRSAADEHKTVHDLLTCKQCQKQCTNLDMFTEHMKQHHARQCLLCPAWFPSDQDLKMHREREHNKVWWIKCIECPAHFRTSVERGHHVMQYHSKKWIQCSECSGQFPDNISLDEHMQSHSVVQIIKKRIQEDATLLANLDSAPVPRTSVDSAPVPITSVESTPVVTLTLPEDQKPKALQPFVRDFQCHLCFRRYGTKQRLDYHIEAHSNPKAKCTYCPKVFSWLKNLQRHIDRVHLRKFASQCDHCGRTFASLASKRKHEDAHESKLKYQFACPMQDWGTERCATNQDIPCSIRCKTKEHLQLHISRHHTAEGIASKYETETKLAEFFTQNGIEFERDWSNSIDFRNCDDMTHANRASARPDFYLTLQSAQLQCVFLVCNDEFAHRYTKCEFRRMSNIAQALELTPKFQNVPIVFVRFNPHPFKVDAMTRDVPLADAHDILLKCILSIQKEDLKPGTNLVYVHYDTTDGKLDIFTNATSDTYANMYRDCILKIVT